jgi:hypothetical protein
MSSQNPLLEAHDGHRWASVTPDDYSGTLYVVAFVGFTYTTMTVVTRVFIKRNMLGIDDGIMVVAQAANVLQFALVISALSAGLSKSYNTISEEQYSRMARVGPSVTPIISRLTRQTQMAVQITTYLTLGLSKMATILIVRRLFTVDMKEPWRTCNVVTGFVIAWTIASAFLVSVGCSAESVAPQTPIQTCPGIRSRYLVVTITDAITDLLLTITPAYLCRQLNMKVWFKLQVLGIFALRLPLVILSAFFFRSWTRSLDHVNPGVARTRPLVYQQCQICYSIIVGTIPSLKAFLQSFDTGSGVKAGFGYSSSQYGSGGSGARQSRAPMSPGLDIPMARIQRRIETSQERNGTARVNKKPSGKTQQTSTDDSIEFGRSSSHESDRRSHTSTQELFIRKDVEWEVTSEAARKGSDINTPGLLRLPM